MVVRLSLVVLTFALFAFACAPPTLDAEHASYSSAQSGDDDDDDDSAADDDDDDSAADDDDDSTATKSPAASSSSGGATASATPATFKTLYSKVKGDCGSCHLTGATGATIFFADDEAGTYQKFKDYAFNQDPSPFAEKGVHGGPALKADQKAAVDAWVAADK